MLVKFKLTAAAHAVFDFLTIFQDAKSNNAATEDSKDTKNGKKEDEESSEEELTGNQSSFVDSYLRVCFSRSL